MIKKFESTWGYIKSSQIRVRSSGGNRKCDCLRESGKGRVGFNRPSINKEKGRKEVED